MGKKISNNKLNMIFPILMAGMLLAISLHFLKDNSSLRIVGDEFGYWNAAAWLSGYDWSDIASNNLYYSFGYGFLLYPVMRLSLSAVEKYRVAIAINCILLSLSYLMIYSISGRIAGRVEVWKRSLISFVAMLYPANLLYTQFTLTETLLLFLYLSLALLLTDCIYSYSSIRIYLSCFIMLYMFSVHQRSLGVILASIMLIIFLQIRNRKWIDMAVCICIFLGGFWGINRIKYIFKHEYMDISALNSMGKGNDFAGQSWKFKVIFTAKGFIKLLKSIAGKLFYLLSASYFLFATAIGLGVKNARELIGKKDKNQEKDNERLAGVYYVLCSLLALAVEALYLLNYEYRYDILMYGRYADYTIPLLLVITMIYILENKLKLRGIIITLIVYILLGSLMYHELSSFDNIGNSFFNSAGIFDAIYLSGNLNEIITLLIKVILTVLLLIGLCFLYRKKEKSFLMFVMAGIMGLSFFYSFYANQNSFSKDEYIRNYEEVAAVCIEYSGRADKVFFYNPDQSIQADYIQFLLGNHSIKVVKEADALERAESDGLVITERDTDLNEICPEYDWKVFAESTRIKVWEKN